jgi:ribosomal protein S27E
MRPASGEVGTPDSMLSNQLGFPRFGVTSADRSGEPNRSAHLEVAMSREQFLEADRRVRCYLCLILLLTACAAVGLAVELPAWPEAREWIRTSGRGEGAAGLLIGLLVEAAVLGPLLLIPFLTFLWVRQRFGLRCPRCKRSVTLRGLSGEVLRSGRCRWCQQTLFEPGGGTAQSDAAPDRGGT